MYALVLEKLSSGMARLVLKQIQDKKHILKAKPYIGWDF
jgi:hypothetical protein